MISKIQKTLLNIKKNIPMGACGTDYFVLLFIATALVVNFIVWVRRIHSLT